MKKLFIIFFVVILGLSSNQTLGQFSLSVGPAIGGNINLHSGDQLWSSLSGFGLVGGAAVDASFSDMFGVLFNLNYDNLSASTDWTVAQPNQQQYDEHVSGSLAYLSIEPLFKLTLPKVGLFFFLGPQLGINLSAKFKQELKTQGLVYQNNQTTQEGDIEKVNMRFGLKGGAGYSISITKMIAIVPQLGIAYGFTNVQDSQNASWKIFNIQFKVAAMFKLVGR